MTSRLVGWVRSPSGLLRIGLALLLMVAVLSTVGESAAEIGQGWVPSVDEPKREDDLGNGFSGPEIEVNTPPALRAFLALLFVLLLLVLVAMTIAGVIILVLGVHTRREGRRASGKTTPEEQVEQVDEADVALVSQAAAKGRELLAAHAGGEPGDAVVRAWLVLEQATAEAGLRRQPHQTPTEFTTEVLAAMYVRASALGRLRALYQRARFSSHPVTAVEAAVALAALDKVVDDLAARVRSPA